MTERTIIVTIASATTLALLLLSPVILAVVLATSAVWCLIIWAVYVR